MSREYSAVMTLTVDGVEMDVRVRAHVAVDWGSGGSEARLDGDAEVRLPEGWFDADDLALGPRDLARIDETLGELALSDEGLDADEYEAAQ